MDEAPLPEGDIRFLKRLVTVLTATMIVGLLVVVALLVIRLAPGGEVAVPERLVLPSGAEAVAFTQGTDWVAVVTADDRILIYDRATGALRQTVEIAR